MMMNTSNDSDSFLEPEIDEYINFLNQANTKEVKVLKKERVKEKLDLYTNALNTFLMYPDILSDIMTPKNSRFSMFFAQRIVLRCMARHRQTFSTFTRAFSKSFLAFFKSYVSSMVIPHHNSFVTAGTKSQAAQIAKEKVIQDLWVKFPMLKNEMKKTGKDKKSPYVEGSDYAEFRFQNGSIFDVVGGHPRGMRRHEGIFEEVIEQDPEVINAEIIPLMNSPRTTCRGEINPHEIQAQKNYITTAGYQGTFAYDKNIETLCYAAIDPDNYMVLGGSYIIPLMHGRLEQKTMEEIISSPTFDKETMDREYVSKWSGAQKGAAFQVGAIEAARNVVRAEFKPDKDTSAFYVVSADMAKDGSANTAVVVLKVIPKQYMFDFKVVFPFTIASTDYEKVANELKRTILNYNARLFVYDANGIGAALRDWINKPTVDESGVLLPGFGIINPPPSAKHDVLRYNKSQTICYEIKASGNENGLIHKVFFSRMSNGTVHFLIKSSEALNRLQRTEAFLRMSDLKRRRLMDPYYFSDQIEQEFKNLSIADTSDNVYQSLKIVRINDKIQKDFFSATEYGVYAVNSHLEQDYYNKRRRSGNGIVNAVFIS